MTALEERAIREARLMNNYAIDIHKKRLLNALKIPFNISLGVVAALGAGSLIDIALYGGYQSQQIMDIIRDISLPVRMGYSASELISYGIFSLSAITLGLWGVDSHIGKKYSGMLNDAQFVLGSQNRDIEQEIGLYTHLTGKDRSDWPRVRDFYFHEMETWINIMKSSGTIIDSNLRLGPKIQKKILYDDSSPMVNIDWLLKHISDDPDNIHINIARGQDIDISLPSLFNKGRSSFRGKLILAGEGNLPVFYGAEVMADYLSDGMYFIGMIEDADLMRRKRKKITEYNNAILKRLDPLIRDAPSRSLKIALVTEGTYPFIRGGVASVTDDLMRGLEHDKFGGKKPFFEAVSIWANNDLSSTKISYDIPDNVHLNQPILIYGYSANPAFERRQDLDTPEGMDLSLFRKRDLINTIKIMEKIIASGNFERFYSLSDHIYENYSLDELLRSFEAISAVYDLYHEETGEKPDFLNYFYQWQSLRQPLYSVIKADKVAADMYYCVVTGVGGVYSALAKRMQGIGLVLTEHGIYKEDRIVDLANSPMDQFFVSKWHESLDFYSKLVYDAADFITTTCECNSYKQIRDGSNIDKIRIIPGSIAVDMPVAAFKDLTNEHVFSVGMLGNVQRVKRVELFIEIADYLTRNYPDENLQFHVMGRDDPSDMSYVKQIHDLVAQKNLNNFHFSPYKDYREAFSILDCGVLTSASEVQPRSVMEFLSMGKPIIAPDVGGLKELLYGIDSLDNPSVDDLGKAGIIVDKMSKSVLMKETADAIMAFYYIKRNIPLTDIQSQPNIVDMINLIVEGKHSPSEVGPMRMNHYCARNTVLPQYARLFKEAMHL